MNKMKAKLVIVTALLFMVISGVRTEDQITDTEGATNNTTNSTTRITLNTYQKQYSDNNVKTEKGTTNTKKQELPKEQFLDHKLREIHRQYLKEKLKEERQDPEHQYLDEKPGPRNEYVGGEELDEKEGEENEDEDHIEDYGEEYQRKRGVIESERLSHQEELYNALNLDQYNHRFEDWSVSMDEEFEDMVKVLGEDDNLPLRDLTPPLPLFKRDQHKFKREVHGEDFFGRPSDKYVHPGEHEERL